MPSEIAWRLQVKLECIVMRLASAPPSTIHRRSLQLHVFYTVPVLTTSTADLMVAEGVEEHSLSARLP